MQVYSPVFTMSIENCISLKFCRNTVSYLGRRRPSLGVIERDDSGTLWWKGESDWSNGPSHRGKAGPAEQSCNPSDDSRIEQASSNQALVGSRATTTKPRRA